VAIPGYGCLPAPQNDECPAGSYSASYNGAPVCVPAGGPKCQGQFCPAKCPAGLVFNEGEFCCDYPTSVQPTCPQGYVYDDNAKACITDTPVQVNCTSHTLVVAACPVTQVDCSGYTNSNDCNSNPACSWHNYASTAGGYCSNK